jgi:hypothetical protein
MSFLRGKEKRMKKKTKRMKENSIKTLIVWPYFLPSFLPFPSRVRG